MRSYVRIPGTRRPRTSAPKGKAGFNPAAMLAALEAMPDAGRVGLDFAPTLESATEPAKTTGKAKRYSHKEENNPDGPSQLEKGSVATMDLRTAIGLRAAIDDAIYKVAQRFGLKYQVLRGQFGVDGAVYKIGLEVKERPRTVRLTGTELIVSSATPGKTLGSARLPKASSK